MDKVVGKKNTRPDVFLGLVMIITAEAGRAQPINWSLGKNTQSQSELS